MEPWQHICKDKIISAEQAAQLVKSGQLVRLYIGKPPIPILKALAKRKGQVEDVTIIQCYPLYSHEIWNEPEYEESFNLVVDYVGAGCRQGILRRSFRRRSTP